MADEKDGRTLAERVDELEKQVAALRRELDAVKREPAKPGFMRVGDG